MKFVLGLVVGIVGVSTLTGCGAEVVGEESVNQQTDALVLVTATALSRGTRRDYDGDGKEDVLFVLEDVGTYETLGKSPGGFGLTASTMIRSDLLPGSVRFSAGDFNHDGKSDLLVTTDSGTVELTGKAGGGFNTNAWSGGASLKRNLVEITVGDFNGDGSTDFIATTSTGSSLYTGKTSGGFNNAVWSNTSTAFKLGNVTFLPGNFDTDATTDFIATTSTGSVLYTGKTTGGFTTSTWSDSSLVTGTARIVVGNFNGVGADDFVVEKFSGAFLYTTKTPQPAGGPGFNISAWTDPTLSISSPPLTVGDFNGDGCADFLYQDGVGLKIRTYKQGTPSVPGTFNAAVLVDSRFRDFYTNSLKIGDFTGDGKDDFIVQMKEGVFGADGSHEFSGTAAANGGFNVDVWTDTGSPWNSAF